MADKKEELNKEEMKNEANEVLKLKEEIEKLKKENEEYLNGWKRAKADFINYQKDEAKREEEIVKFSNEFLIKELLPVLDSFELSFSMIDKDSTAKKGVEMIYAQFERILSKHGLEPIKCLGEKFDANLHEALEEVKSEKESGMIVEELEKGWKLRGKVIRPSRVKVAK